MRRLSTMTLLAALSVSAIGLVAAPASASTPAPFLRITGDAASVRPVHATPSPVRPSRSAGLTIVATFDPSITGNPDGASIQLGIRQAIAKLESQVHTTVCLTVQIAFASVDTGLGASATYYGTEPYSQFRADAKRLRTSTYDRQAYANLTYGHTNPVNGGSTVNLTLPLLRATGEAALGNAGGHVDSTIYLNTGIMNLLRTGPQDPDKYDLRQVVTHEIVEALGAGGAGSGLVSGDVGPLDLYRYSARGVRSFTTAATAVSYFSVDGGLTRRGYFNQDSGGDYGDWDSDLNHKPQVQDAFSTPGVQLDLSRNELIALDVVGYTVDL